jgi:hypothetical protein
VLMHDVRRLHKRNIPVKHLTLTIFLVLAAAASAAGRDAMDLVRGKTTETGTYHETRGVAGKARHLLAQGSPEGVAAAEKVLDLVMAAQDRREGSRYYGNFFWMLEDDRVRDTNAVEFTLGSLIPMMADHGDRLSAPIRERVLECIRLGLGCIQRMDTTVAYTNIAVYDILNSSTGGELLQDEAIARRGYEKLQKWEAFTCANGTAFEFNSPTYTRVAVGSLGRLIHRVQDQDTRVRAQTLAARLGLGTALRIHRATGRLAGPHSRAYQPNVECQTGPEAEDLRGWIANGTLPTWVGRALDGPALPMEVTETASVAAGIAVTTYQSPSFALGVGTRSQVNFGRQSNLLMGHYTRPGAERPGVMYARYLTNDKWLGDWYHTSDRSSSRNLLDEGLFYGAQSGPGVVGVYTTKAVRSCTSAKAVLIWTEREFVDEIWVGSKRVETLPAPVKPGEVVVVASGSALMAVIPLAPTDFGGGAPIRFAERSGSLVLEMYNYQGPETMLRVGGNRPRCGYYVEMAERSQYAQPRDFAKVVASGKLKERVKGHGTGKWTVEYAREGQKVGLEVNLAEWKLERRWTQDGPLGWPMLESPVARQNADGTVEVGGATLTCGKHPAWLFADPASKTWVAGYHGDPAPLRLTVPGGTVEVSGMGTGTVAWENGAVTVNAVDLNGTPEVTGGALNPAP